MRARDSRRLYEAPILPAEPLVTVRAGESLTLRVNAIDRQSGVAEIVARCRSVENHDLSSAGRWVTADPARGADRDYPIVLPIPAHSPSVVWEVHQIILSDAQGNRRTYHAGKDFDAMRFRVKGREGIDCTPPHLLGVKFGHA